jgi:hypothetical protein
MSSLLEEAIIDAKALKEAALKSAENAVLEKYSVEVKNAIGILLEQGLGMEPDPMGMEALTVDELDGGDEDDMRFTDDIPYAFQNEELDSPAEDEVIEINFDALKDRFESEDDFAAEDLNDAMDMADEFSPAPDEELDFSADAPESGLSPEGEEDIDLSEDILSGLVEELTLDMRPNKQGWSSLNSADNEVEQANNDAIADALETYEDEDEFEDDELAGLSSDVVKMYENKIFNLTKSVSEMRSIIKEAKTQLVQLNLENAKLVYQNKALNSASLNERQKVKTVEAVQSAKSVEEAKVIFETIQNAAGRPDTNQRPQTLREAVTRPTSLLFNAQRNNEAVTDPTVGRMLRLAGLTK